MNEIILSIIKSILALIPFVVRSRNERKREEAILDALRIVRAKPRKGLEFLSARTGYSHEEILKTSRNSKLIKRVPIWRNGLVVGVRLMLVSETTPYPSYSPRADRSTMIRPKSDLWSASGNTANS